MASPFRNFFKESALYLFGLLLSRSISFLLLPIYTNVFNRTQNGIITLVYAFLGFMSVILPYGSDAAMLNFYVRDDKEKHHAFSNAYTMIFFSNVIILSVAFLFRGSLTPILLGIGNSRYLTYCIVILMIDSLNSLSLIVIRAENKPALYTCFNLINVALMMTLNILFVVKYRLGIDGIFYSNMISSAAIWFGLLPIVLKRFQIRYVSKKWIRTLFRFGIPFLPSGIFAMILEVADRWMLAFYTDMQTVGIYGVGYKLGAIMLILVLGINTSWQPFFLHQSKEKNAPALFSRITTIIVGGLAFCWLFFSLWVDQIARISIGNKYLIGAEFWPGIRITPVILLAYFFQALYLLQLPGVFILNKTRFEPIFRGCGAAANILLNIVLIPYFGMIGAAVATCAAYALMALLIYFFNQKNYPIPYDWKRIGGIALLTAGAYLITVGSGVITVKIISTVLLLVAIYFISFRRERTKSNL